MATPGACCRAWWPWLLAGSPEGDLLQAAHAQIELRRWTVDGRNGLRSRVAVRSGRHHRPGGGVVTDGVGESNHHRGWLLDYPVARVRSESGPCLGPVTLRAIRRQSPRHPRGSAQSMTARTDLGSTCRRRGRQRQVFDVAGSLVRRSRTACSRRAGTPWSGTPRTLGGNAFGPVSIGFGCAWGHWNVPRRSWS